MTFIAMVLGTPGQAEVGLKTYGVKGATLHSSVGCYCRFLIPESENDKLLRWLMRPSKVPHPPMTLMYFTPYTEGDYEREVPEIGFGQGHRASRRSVHKGNAKLLDGAEATEAEASEATG